jgi:hypothetical protein
MTICKVFAKSILLVLFLLCIVVAAKDKTSQKSRELKTVVPAGGISADGVILKTGLAESVKYLLKQVEKNLENKGEAFFAIPHNRGKITGYEEYELRYSWKSRKVPVYELEYYTVMQRNSAGEVKPVRKSRIKRQTGTKDYKYLQQDPNGSVVKTHKRAIKEKGGGVWQFLNGTFGQNGMALFACLNPLVS